MKSDKYVCSGRPGPHRKGICESQKRRGLGAGSHGFDKSYAPSPDPDD